MLALAASLPVAPSVAAVSPSTEKKKKEQKEHPIGPIDFVRGDGRVQAPPPSEMRAAVGATRTRSLWENLEPWLSGPAERRATEENESGRLSSYMLLRYGKDTPTA
ncbi:hypothetical protein MTO96_013503 [Rhipicephalus appendiculatus]